MLEVKVCGLTDAAAVEAAAAGGARWLGFVFYPPSPRALSPAQAAALAALAPESCRTVGVLVDPDDAQLEALLGAVALDALQLHGAQTPERVAAIKAATGCLVIKALSIAEAEDLAPLAAYAEVADLLLFDARPPRDPAALPGGNGLRFDWRLLQDLRVDRPWLLAGGLNAANLESAVRLCGARAVDVSTGVEDRPGHKDPARIKQFLAVAAALGAPA
jgi:phosphoribosylanthranilate isomerase